MLRIFSLTILIAILAIGFACGSQDKPAAASPAEAYTLLYAAVKSKDTEAIKKHLSKKTIEFGVLASAKNGTPIEKTYENGFTATTFSETLPSIRDERIKDNMGAVEVWNAKESLWEDVPFVYEDGTWKAAFGDLFAGTFKSPGRGRDRLERDAANAVAANSVRPATNTNNNMSTPITTTVPLPEPDNK